MTTHTLIFQKGHALVNLNNGLFLIDTGSPLSFSATGEIEVDGECIAVNTGLMGVDANYVSEKVGQEATGLIGMDILGQRTVKIDYPNQTICFNYEGEVGEELPSSVFQGSPCIELNIEGQQCLMVLDTGAPISYAPRKVTAGKTPTDSVEDFNPMMPGDVFTTPLYQLQTCVAGKEYSFTYGVLPQALGMMLGMVGIDGAIGKALLDEYAVVLKDGRVFVS